MAKSTVVIEQLFENLHQEGNSLNETDGGNFDSDDNPSRDKTLAKQRKAPLLPKRRGRQNVDRADTGLSPDPHLLSLATTNVSARPSKISDIQSVSVSVSSRSKSRPQSTASLGENCIKYPISYDVALALFSNKLTPLEQIEIQNYENIYFMGLGANKINATKNDTVDLFDDDDCNYKAVPHDHIAYRYETLDKPLLGKGTFAQVIRAHDHKEKRKVAIKIVRNERIYLKQSREELRILQVMRKADSSGAHNIVNFYEFFMFRNHMCITFELLGMNLYQVLKKNQFKGLGLNKIMSVARSTLKCMELLYKCRIIHCDIKPENIMLRRNGDFSSITVGDFGSSCYEQQQVYHYVQSRFYRAPEVMLGMRYGPAIDMWSLGCVLGELSHGYPIFMGRDDSDQLSAIEELMGQLPADMRVNSRVTIKHSPGRGAPGSKALSSVVSGDDNFKGFVKQMLEWDPATRPSPGEMQQHHWLKSRSPSTAKVASSKSHPGAMGRTKKPSSRRVKESL